MENSTLLTGGLPTDLVDLPLDTSPEEPQQSQVQLPADLQDLPDDFKGLFGKLSSDFQTQFKRPFRVTTQPGSPGYKNLHKNLHKSNAADIGGNDLTDDEANWIVQQGGKYGLNVKDYRKNWKTIGGTAPHIHIDDDLSAVSQEPISTPEQQTLSQVELPKDLIDLPIEQELPALKSRSDIQTQAKRVHDLFNTINTQKSQLENAKGQIDLNDPEQQSNYNTAINDYNNKLTEFQQLAQSHQVDVDAFNKSVQSRQAQARQQYQKLAPTLNAAAQDIGQFEALKEQAAQEKAQSTGYLDNQWYKTLQIAQQKALEIQSKYGKHVEVGNLTDWPYVKPIGWGITKTGRPASEFSANIPKEQPEPTLQEFMHSVGDKQIEASLAASAHLPPGFNLEKAEKAREEGERYQAAAQYWHDKNLEEQKAIGLQKDIEHLKAGGLGVDNTLRHWASNLLTGLGETAINVGVKAEELSPIGQLIEQFRPQTRDEVRHFLNEINSTAQIVTQRNEGDKFFNNLLYQTGRLAPKMIAPGGIIGFAVTEGLDALGHGASPQEVLKQSLLALGTAKLAHVFGITAASIPSLTLSHTIPNAVENFAKQWLAYSTAPAVVNFLTTAKTSDARQAAYDIAFGALFTLYGARVQDIDPMKPLPEFEPVLTEMRNNLVELGKMSPADADAYIQTAYANAVIKARNAGVDVATVARNIRKGAADFWKNKLDWLKEHNKNAPKELGTAPDIEFESGLEEAVRQAKAQGLEVTPEYIASKFGLSIEKADAIISKVSPTPETPAEAESIKAEESTPPPSGITPETHTALKNALYSDAEIAAMTPERAHEAVIRFEELYPAKESDKQLPGVVYRNDNGAALEVLDQVGEGYRVRNQNGKTYLIHQNATFVPEQVTPEGKGQIVLNKQNGQPLTILGTRGTGYIVKNEAGKIFTIHQNATVLTTPEILSKEPPVPEAPATLASQMEALEAGRKAAVQITPGAQMPVIPSGFITTDTPVGTFIHSSNLHQESVVEAVASGDWGHLLGIVAPRPEAHEPAITVLARDKAGHELQSAVVPPDMVDAQSDEFKKVYPDSDIVIGGKRVIQSILQHRTEKLPKEEQRGLTEAETIEANKARIPEGMIAVGPEHFGITAEKGPLPADQRYGAKIEIPAEEMIEKGMPTFGASPSKPEVLSKEESKQTPQQVGLDLRNKLREKHGTDLPVSDLMTDISSFHVEMKKAELDAQGQLEAFRTMGFNFKDPVQMIGTIRGTQSELGRIQRLDVKYKSGGKLLDYRVLGRFPGGEKIMVMTPDSVIKIIQSPLGQTGNSRIKGEVPKEIFGKIPTIKWQEIGMQGDAWPTKAEIHRVNPSIDDVLDLTDDELQENFPEVWRRVQEAQEQVGNAAGKEFLSIAYKEGDGDDNDSIQESRDRLHELFNANIRPNNTSQWLYDTAVVVGNDILKLHPERSEWEQRVTERLGDDVKHHLANVWDAINGRAPMFFSPLERVLKTEIPNKGQAAQVKGIIRKAGVSDDEMKWTGFDEFLKDKAMKEEPVTRQEALDFFQKNKVSLTERVFESKEAAYLDAKNKALMAEVPTEEFQRAWGARSNWMADSEQTEFPYEEYEHGDVLKREIEPIVQRRAGLAKFESNTTPGGINNREITLSLPDRTMQQVVEIERQMDEIAKRGAKEHLEHPEWRDDWDKLNEERKRLNKLHRSVPASHKYDIPEADVDRITIIRVNDRLGSNNERILHVDELQDDLQNEIQAMKFRINEIETGTGTFGSDVYSSEEKRALLDAAKSDLNRLQSLLPFRGKSHELTMKYALGYAINHGYDMITWATGRQVADRYNLRQQISSIAARKLGNNRWSLAAHDLRGASISGMPDDISSNELSDWVGKDLANQIINQQEKLKYYEGLDLSKGGEGKLYLYDKMIPDFIRKYTKKWNGRVDTTTLPQEWRGLNKATNEETVWSRPTREEAQSAIDVGRERGAFQDDYEPVMTKGVDVHSLSITPPMRDSILRSGQSLFGSSEGQPSEVTEALSRLKDTQARKRRNPSLNELNDILSKEKGAELESKKDITKDLRNSSPEAASMISVAETGLGKQMASEVINRASRSGRTIRALGAAGNAVIDYRKNSNRLYVNHVGEELIKMIREDANGGVVSNAYGATFDINKLQGLVKAAAAMQKPLQNPEAIGVLDDLIKAFKSSIRNNEPLVISDYSALTGPGVRKTVKHEEVHRIDLMIRDAFDGIVPDVEEMRQLPHMDQLTRRISGKMGYSNDPRIVAMEAIACISTGDNEELKLTPDEEVDFMDGYYTLMADTYHEDVLDQYKLITDAARKVRDEVKKRYGSISEGISDAAGTVSGMEAGRQGRLEEEAGTNAASRQADASYDYLSRRISSGSLGTNPSEDSYHISVVSGYQLLRDTPEINKDEWQKTILTQLGERARPHLDEIWDKLTGKAPTFYSPVQNLITSKVPNKASVEQVRGILKGISEDELKWSGLNDLLKEKEKNKESITKQDLLDHLALNNISVKTITSGVTIKPLVWQGFIDLPNKPTDIRSKAVDDAGYSYVISQVNNKDNPLLLMISDPSGKVISTTKAQSMEAAHGLAESLRWDKKSPEEIAKSDIELLRQEGYEAEPSPDGTGEVGFWTIDENGDRGDDLILIDELPNYLQAAAGRIQDAYVRSAQGDTRYSEYKLEGGKPNSYVEIKLTLPDRSRKAMLVPGSTREGKAVWQWQSLGEKTLSKDFDSREEAINNRPEDYTYIDDAHHEIEDIQYSQRGEVYQSPHYEDPDLLAHIRGDEREHTDGVEGFIIDETQSDWSHDIRTKGIKLSQEEDAALHLEEGALNNKIDDNRVKLVYEKISEEKERELKIEQSVLMDRLLKVSDRLNKNIEAVPNAPLIKQWPLLTVKQAIRHAVEQDLSRISIVGARVHIDRWGTERAVWQKVPLYQIRSKSGGHLVTNVLGHQPVSLWRETADLNTVNDFMAKTPTPEDANIEEADKHGWLFQFKAQEGGQAGGINLEQEGLARGLISSGDSVIIRSKDDLLKEIKRNRASENAEAIADKLWNRMQKEDEGVSWPRAEGQLAHYGETSDYIKQRFPNRPDLLKFAWDRGDGKQSEAFMPIAMRDVGKAWKANIHLSEFKINESPYYIEPNSSGTYDSGNKYSIVDRDRGTYLTKPNGEVYLFESEWAANNWMRENKSNYYPPVQTYSLDITPSMSNAIIRTGQPLYGSSVDDPVYVLDAKQRMAPQGRKNIIDMGIVVGHDILSKETEFKSWQDDMLHQLGESIRPHLDSIWSRLQEAGDIERGVELENKIRPLIEESTDLESRKSDKKDDKRLREIAKEVQAIFKDIPKPQQIKMMNWSAVFKAEDAMDALKAAGDILSKEDRGVELESKKPETDEETKARLSAIFDDLIPPTPEPSVTPKERGQDYYYIKLLEKEIAKQKATGQVNPNLQKTYDAMKAEVKNIPVTATGSGGSGQGGGKFYDAYMDNIPDPYHKPSAWDTIKASGLATPWRSPGKAALEVINFFRAFMTAPGIAPARHSLVLFTTNPLSIGTKAFGKGMKAAVSSKESFKAQMEELASQPDFDFTKKIMGIEYTGPEVHRREELFRSSVAELLPHVRGSSQSFVGTLNWVRYLASSMMAKELQEGVSWIPFVGQKLPFGRLKGVTPEEHPDVYFMAGRWINSATGRGYFGRFSHEEALMDVVNTGLFSARLQKGRIDLLNPWTYKKLPLEARVLAMRKMFEFSSLIFLMLGLAAAAGFKTTMDIDDPDFGKIVKGNFHFDLTAGFASYIRMTALSVRDIIRGDRQHLSKIWGHFIWNKLAPFPASLVNLTFGKDHKSWGEPTSFKKEMTDLVTPIFVQSLVKGYKDSGISGAILAGVPSLFHMGMEVYPQYTSSPNSVLGKKISERRLDHLRSRYGDEPLSIEDKDKIETEKKIVDTLKAGSKPDGSISDEARSKAGELFNDAVSKGLLAPTDTKRIEKKATLNAQYDPSTAKLVYNIETMPFEEQLDMFLDKDASKEERIAMAPVIGERYMRWLKQRDDEAKEHKESVPRYVYDRILSKLEQAKNLGIVEMAQEKAKSATAK